MTLTLTAESGEETTGTVTFVSSAREFNGTGLSTLIVTAALAAGTEVFAATDAGLTIWHSPNESEFYTLEGANANLFTVGAAGAVSVKGEIRPTELVRYELTLALTDGGVTARRGLAVELTPPLLEADEDFGLTVTVGRGGGGGREFCAVRECERIRERGRLGGGVVVGDGRDGVV